MAVVTSLITTGIKFIIFIGIACAGVVLGKKFKDKKTQN